MINNNKRREVARRLRDMPCDIYELEAAWKRDGIETECHDQTDYYQIHEAILGCLPAEHMHPGDYEEIHSRLADLVDRPTCKNASGYCDVFQCSACGCKVEITAEVGIEHGGSFHVPFMPSYCPSCGAEASE